MTEDQANVTRCCGPEGCGGNSSGEPERYCIASVCMAWRWIEDAEFKCAAEAAYRRAGVRMKPDQGFCGLAGPSHSQPQA